MGTVEPQRPRVRLDGLLPRLGRRIVEAVRPHAKRVASDVVSEYKAATPGREDTHPVEDILHALSSDEGRRKAGEIVGHHAAEEADKGLTWLEDAMHRLAEAGRAFLRRRKQLPPPSLPPQQ